MSSSPAARAVARSSRLHLSGLLLLCAWLFLLKLGDIPFLGKDEPKNAEALLEMSGRGDWVTTTLRGEPWFDKPILYYWVSLIFFRLLGPGEAAARLGPALFGAAGVLVTWWLARSLFDAKTALRSGVVLATSLEYFWFSRTAVVDLPLTFCVTLCLAAFYRALEAPGTPTRWYLLAFGAMGGATLAKGPVGIVLPALVVGAYLLLGRRLRAASRVPWGRSILCFLVVAAPWYTVVSLRHGWRFWEDFILNRNIDRYLTTIHHHPGPVYYYLPVLLIGLFPWGALLPFAVGRILREGWRDLVDGRRHLGFLLLWALMPLLFFSFAGSKLPSYLLPCFPALAILAAHGWGAVLERRHEGGAVTGRWAIVLLLLVFPLLAAGIFAWCRSEAPGQIPAQAPLGFALAATAAAIAVAAAAGKRRLLFPVCTGGTILCLTALLTFSLGNVREAGSLTRISQRGVQLARAGATVVAYRNFHNSLYFYTENRIPFVKKRSDLDRLVREKEMVFSLVEEPGLKELSGDSALFIDVIDRQNKVTLARVRPNLCIGRP